MPVLLQVNGHPPVVLRRLTGWALETNGEEPATPTRWTPGRVFVGVNMGEGLHEWISTSLAGRTAGADGLVRIVSASGDVESFLTFSNASIGEVRFPALSADKNVANIELEI